MGEAPVYQLQPAWLETLDWVLEQAQQSGLLVILDLHEFLALATDPIGLKPKVLAFWQQISTRYQAADEDVFFEILNEPNAKLTPELWNEYLQEPVALIRATNPTRQLIIGPAFWNGIDFLDQLELPENDPNLIVTVHYYHPMDFTHQGAPWSVENRQKSGIDWSGSEVELERLRRDFNGVQAWAKAHNYPIYLGEFGAYEKAGMLARAIYTNAVAREAERQGWSWGYWQFDSDFIVYDFNQQAWVEPILKALIPASPSN
jgi:endoglucanase